MRDQLTEPSLFPPIEPYQTGRLAVDDVHNLYWEECGNPKGIPVVFLHGGPGGGLSPLHRRFFHPEHYRIVLFDQRGSGKSTPLGEYRANTTPLLVDDIERLRSLLGIDKWLVFGGSWGSTLALAYGEAHPERCLGFVLRGIFLCTRSEVNWFVNGMGQFYPEVHAEFANVIPPEERGDLLEAYSRRLFHTDPAVYMPAARAWAKYEGSCLFLRPQAEAVDEFTSDRVSLGLGRLEAHYMRHHGFFTDDQLIKDIDRIRHLPGVIIQGRYDVICPPTTAYRLHRAWPEARMHMVDDAGHAAMEPGISRGLVAATEQFRRNGRFD